MNANLVWPSAAGAAPDTLIEFRRVTKIYGDGDGAMQALAGVDFRITDRFEDAFADADVVIPKSWGPLLHTRDKEEGIRLIGAYPSWRCDAERMALGKPSMIYMHPLPADRGREVTDDVIDGPQSVVYDEAENRLHVQKALMALTM
mgnify:CR=1 FL=1